MIYKYKNGKSSKGANKMKKSVVILMLVVAILTVSFLMTTTVYAKNETILDKETESKLVELKENSEKSIEYYKEKYGSDAYGVTAYVLHLISIYSIPFCFLGIAISGIYQYVIGIRKLDVKEKGLTLMVTFVTLLVICQILPLAFAIVVKFGRG